MHPGGPRLAAVTAIIAATLGHWRPKVAASIAVAPLCWATGGRLPAACPACCRHCLVPKALGHLVTAAVATR